MSTFFISATNAFIRGYARSFDMFVTIQTRSCKENDSEAIYHDWNMIGHDMRKALNKYGKEKNTNNANSAR